MKPTLKNFREIAALLVMIFLLHPFIRCSAETPTEVIARVVAEIRALQAARSNATSTADTTQDGSGSPMAADGAPHYLWGGSCATCATNLLLLTPVLQGSNAILTAASGETNVFDLYTRTDLTASNAWTWVARGTNGQQQFVVSNVPSAQSYFHLACTNEPGLVRPPPLVDNLRLWLKADDGAVVVSGRVQPWLDRSGSGNDATQPTFSSQPLYLPAWINGRPALYFPGTNYFALPGNIFTNVLEAEVFVVLQAAADPPPDPRGLWFFGGASLYTDADRTIFDSFGANAYLNTGPPAQALDQPHIYNVLAKTNEWTSRINGVVHYSQNFNTAQFGGPRYLGNGGNGIYFAGYIAELLIYGRGLSETERFDVGTYLARRYNLVTASPPAPAELSAWAVSSDQISLTWSNALSNTNVTFTVQRRAASDPCYTSVGTVQNGQSYLDSGLAAGTQYYYRVAAGNYSAMFASSPETNATTLTNVVGIPLDRLRLWLKADCGHGGNPVNYWVDQSGSGNGGYHPPPSTAGIDEPVWVEGAMNGKPAMYFAGSNAFYLPHFIGGWTQGEVFAVVKSLGSTETNWVGLWLMGAGALASYYPFTNSTIWENFGRSGSPTISTSSPVTLSNPHLYNVLSMTNYWVSRINNNVLYSTNVNAVGFQGPSPRIGWGGDPEHFRGYISELMIFDRVLADAEREAVAVSYLRRRFNIW
jgi:hypothetical protein